MRPRPDPATLRRRALDLLARREHSVRELHDKLQARGFERHAVADLVQTLQAENLLSDRRYAQSLASARMAAGKGSFRISADLRAAGVQDGDIEAALDALEADWAALARGARVRRFGISPPATASDKARQMRFLQRRGFEHDHICAAFTD